jgi:TPR repeat protein
MKAHVCFIFLAAFGISFGRADQPDLSTVRAQAAQGNVLAEYKLGRAYHLGQGVPQDYTKAAELYRKAAAQGDAKSMYNLGYIYLHGQGVPKDSLAAAGWFQKAADSGLAAGQLQLGLFYYFGDMGIKKDYAVATRWLTLAARQENSPAQSAPAANALGAIYESQSNVPNADAQAVFWYKKGAEMGNAKAQSNLGRIYLEGTLTPRDNVEGYMWLKLASIQGEQMATHLLPEYLGSKAFNAAQIAEGNRRVLEFESKHRALKTVAETQTPPAVMDPDVMVKPGRSAAPALGTVANPASNTTAPVSK